jgi:hypothetical protein
MPSFCIVRPSTRVASTGVDGPLAGLGEENIEQPVGSELGRAVAPGFADQEKVVAPAVVANAADPPVVLASLENEAGHDSPPPLKLGPETRSGVVLSDPEASHLLIRPSRPEVRNSPANDLDWAAIGGRVQVFAPLAVAGGLRFEATGTWELAVRQGMNKCHARISG